AAPRDLPVRGPPGTDRGLAARLRSRAGRCRPDRGDRRGRHSGNRGLGVGGIHIAVGKLAVYTAAGGIDPARTIPVMLDVGTDRQSLLDDPLYIGNRHPRVPAAEYDAFLDEFVRAVGKLFPLALLHWEDLGVANARRLLERYRDERLTFNDDIQGTGAVNLAAVLAATRATGVPLAGHRIVIFGMGTAGAGIADQLTAAMVAEGLPEEEARRRFWAVDRQ